MDLHDQMISSASLGQITVAWSWESPHQFGCMSAPGGQGGFSSHPAAQKKQMAVKSIKHWQKMSIKYKRILRTAD